MRARLLLCTTLLLGAAECEEAPTPSAPGRTVLAELYDPGPNVSDRRSQDSGLLSWDGGEDLLFVPMRRPVSTSARVVPADSSTGLADVCIFLDTSGSLSDLGRSSDSAGNWGYGVVPGVYDALVAPGCLVGEVAALPPEELTISTASVGTPFEWTLPEALPVRGEVLRADGTGVAGLTVTAYRTDEPGQPLGVAATTGPGGAFDFQLPQGFYDLTVSSPANGLVAAPPIRGTNRSLPPSQNVAVTLRLPPVPLLPVRGSLEDGSGNLLGGRVRIEGDIDPIGFPIEYPGGTYRAEFDTDGEWELELPAGRYTASSFPPHAGLNQEQILGVAETEFAVDATLGPPDDVALVYAEPRLGRVVVRTPGGDPMPSLINLRMTSPPHFAWQYPTDEDGVLVTSLVADLYDVEVLPARIPGGTKIWARTHGQLDVRDNNAEVALSVPRSDVFEGVVVTQDQGQIGNMRIVLRDPVTGQVVDDALSDDTDRFRGFFRGVLPRTP